MCASMCIPLARLDAPEENTANLQLIPLVLHKHTHSAKNPSNKSILQLMFVKNTIEWMHYCVRAQRRGMCACIVYVH